MEHFILANVIQFPNVSFSLGSDTFCSICMKYIAVIPNGAIYLSFSKSTLAEKAMAPIPVLLPGKPHGRRSLVGCSPWGPTESDTTELLDFHFSLSCIGEGNGSPLQCSCLERPRDSGAWWAAVYGVAQSQTRLK